MKKTAFIALIMVVVLSFCSISASAMLTNFEIDRSEGVVWVHSNTKDLSGSIWKISNFDEWPSYFFPGSSVVGFKVKNPAATVSYSNYHTLSTFCYRTSYNYTTVPALGADLRLNAQVDSTSTYSTICVVGEWIS